MTLITLRATIQQRVDDDKGQISQSAVAQADLLVAEALLAATSEIGDMVSQQATAATARVAAALAASTAAAQTVTNIRNALTTAFGLDAAKKAKLDKAFTDANYQTDFDAVQTAISSLATDSLGVADARIDAEASRQKVLARAAILAQWLAIPQGSIAATKPLMALAQSATEASDLATASWATTIVDKYLAVVDDADTAKAVSDAVKDLTDQADDYADKLDAWITAVGTVASDATALDEAKQTLATTGDAVKQALVPIVATL